MNAGGGWGILDCLELVSTWFNALFSEPEAQVGHLSASKDTFLEVDFDVVLDKLFQHLL